MVAVVAAVRREVEGHRQALLPGRQVAAIEGVGILGRGEPGVLPDRPGLVGVHGGVGAAPERRDARPAVHEIEAPGVGAVYSGFTGMPSGVSQTRPAASPASFAQSPGPIRTQPAALPRAAGSVKSGKDRAIKALRRTDSTADFLARLAPHHEAFARAKRSPQACDLPYSTFICTYPATEAAKAVVKSCNRADCGAMTGESCARILGVHRRGNS